MVKKPWRPRKGEAGNYLQRAPVLRKLGISLADFRRLCILKGVFPRTPKKKLDGRHKVYYHVKDIAHLAHEPLLEKFREQKTLIKKIHKALSKNEPDRARSIFQRAPKYSLSHILKERYPTLVHALRDLDDALSCLALFAALPVSNKENIDGPVVKECKTLVNQWMAFTSEIGCLDKVFASIKGYYYQVTLFGEKIVWLMPHEFTTKPAEEVDLKIMATFLELYRALTKFSLFKLYQLAGYEYPPLPRRDGLGSDDTWLNLELKRSSERSAIDVADESTGVTLLSTNEESAARRQTFSKQVIYLSRETPIKHLAYCVKSGGCRKVGFDESLQARDQPLSQIKLDDTSITHHVVDRPLKAMEKLEDQIKSAMRSFVQPQWIMDSFNAKKVLPTTPYAPGNTPPAHLSPFVDDKLEGYIPQERLMVAEWAGHDTKELETVEKEEEAATEERERRVLVLPRKKRELAERIEAKEKSKKEKVTKLKSKRTSLGAST